MAAEYEMTLNDYLSILKRRLWVIVLVASVVIAGAIVAAVVLPPVYQSTGTILIESQQISKDVVQSSDTSFAAERIEVIKRRVMTRENLYKIMQKYGLYQDKLKKQSITALVMIMKNDIAIELVSAEGASPWDRKSTIAFTVSFEYGDPDIAHKVTNELVTLFLDENVKSRTEKATETTEFLSQEADTLRKELEVTEAKVAEFKEKYSGALPEQMDMHMTMLQRTESDIKEIDRDYKTTQEELRYLDVELASAKSGIGRTTAAGNGTVVLSSAAELDKVKLELERAQALYSDSHPTIKSLKRRIEGLEKQVQADKAAAGDGDQKGKTGNIETDLMVAKVQAKIDAAKARLESLSEQRNSLRGRMNDLATRISRSPEVEKGLFSLMRDYENAKSKYEEVKSKQINAKIAENLEQENKAERFVVVEPPIYPDKPIKPNRKKVIALGVFGGFGAAFGLVFLLEIVNARVRGLDALESITKVRTLVALPYIYTQAEIKRKKYFYRYIIIGILVFVLVSSILVHFLVMPLDILLVKVLNRFS
jgi:polysaccharide chain length determinant protein (PEP-CTERM system associated)